MEQLHKQPSSVDDANDAQSKYKFRHQFNSIIPNFVADEYDRTSFRLVCDDFRYGNMIVNNAKELKIIAVIDWEWTYAAPYQMFSSAPRWLLMKNPIFWATPKGWEFDRYNACLELFLDELEREENDRTGDSPLAHLMRKSVSDGRFWFHELLYDCFTGPDNSAWKAICDMHLDVEKLAPIPELELDNFVARKLKPLAAYKAEWSAVKASVDCEQAELNETVQQPALGD